MDEKTDRMNCFLTDLYVQFLSDSTSVLDGIPDDLEAAGSLSRYLYELNYYKKVGERTVLEAQS